MSSFLLYSRYTICMLTVWVLVTLVVWCNTHWKQGYYPTENNSDHVFTNISDKIPNLFELERTQTEITSPTRRSTTNEIHSSNLDFVLLKEQLPNLPLAYCEDNKYRRNYTSGCGRYPDIYNIEFNNMYWQNFQTTNGSFQLYSAFFDDRNQYQSGKYIRIIAMINRRKPTVKTYCQLWFETIESCVLAPVIKYHYIWIENWNNWMANSSQSEYYKRAYQPYLTTCRVPQAYKNLIPASVSLVERPCDHATNNLRVHYKKPAERNGIAVCVKGLDYPHHDISVRLIEWIELLLLLGVKKIYFYELQIHPNVAKVLQHYVLQGHVDLTPHSLTAGEPNLPILQHMYLNNNINHRKRLNEVIPYNDCFNRNMYTYEYIVCLDVDEVVLPSTVMSWENMMHILRWKARANDEPSFCFKNVFFFNVNASDKFYKDVPRYMHMLQNVRRAVVDTNTWKCVHIPERVLTVHNHYPIECLRSKCSTYCVPINLAKMHHYRGEWPKVYLKDQFRKMRERVALDTAVGRYKEQLVSRVEKTLRKLEMKLTT